MNSAPQLQYPSCSNPVVTRSNSIVSTPLQLQCPWPSTIRFGPRAHLGGDITIIPLGFDVPIEYQTGFTLFGTSTRNLLSCPRLCVQCRRMCHTMSSLGPSATTIACVYNTQAAVTQLWLGPTVLVSTVPPTTTVHVAQHYSIWPKGPFRRGYYNHPP
jgi:hypothetical protein